MIFETHAHYEDSQFDEGREALLASLPNCGIKRVINVGSSMETTQKSVALAEQYDHIYAAVGVHPSEIKDLNEEAFSRLQEWTKQEKVVAVGEIGLDYYWDKEEAVLKEQRYWFKRQIKLAIDARLPIIVHSRDAAFDTMNVMKESHATETTGVIHCYSYSLELAREFVQMGYYIGVGGVVTFKNAKKLKETVAGIPLEHIVLETDCPYMAPEPFRGKRNDSRYLPYVVDMIAQIKQISTDEVEAITWNNAYELFQKVKK